MYFYVKESVALNEAALEVGLKNLNEGRWIGVVKV